MRVKRGAVDLSGFPPQLDLMLNVTVSVILLLSVSVLVPRGLERFVPETPLGLGLLAAASSVILWLLAALLFAVLYAWQDARVITYLGAAEGLGRMLGLGAQAALIWAPLMLLTVMTAPRRWKTGVW